MQKNFKLNEWVLIWLKTYKKIMVKPSTFDSYLTYASNVTCETLLADLTVFDIQKMVNDMVVAEKATSTIKHMLTITRQALLKARKMGFISDLSCMDGIELPKARKKAILPFTDYQLQLIQNNLHCTHYGSLYKALILTGCRIGELIALRWSDVDFFNRVIYIRNTDYCGTLQSVKTADGARTLPMNESLFRLLRRQRKPGVINADRVFKNTLGNPVKYRTLLDNWHYFCDKIGIARVGLHTFRHTFAHNALRAGVPVKVVSAWLGHADVYITLQIYDSVTVEDLAECAKLLDSVL